IHGGKPIDGTKFAFMANDCRLDPSPTVATHPDGTARIRQKFIITPALPTHNHPRGDALWDDLLPFNPAVANLWGGWAAVQGTCAAEQTNIYTFFTGLQGGNWTNAVDGLGNDLGYGLTIMNRDNVRFYTPPAPRPTLAIARAIAGVEFVPLPSLATPSASNM